MRRRKTAIFFLILGICLIVIAVALNIGWILLNLREVALLVLGVIFFAVIITGLVLNTIFLFREIRRNERHDAFLNAVTHELKTPIASIKLYLETLKSREVTQEKRNEFYDTMLADSDRLLFTVEQVLAASRTREKKRRVHKERVDLGVILAEAAGLVRSRYNLPEGVIRFSTPSEPMSVLADTAELQAAFVNLLDNAVKYSGAGARITVRTQSAALKNKVNVFIRDNGIGIPPGELKRIFKRFYRVDDPASRGTKGTGLGLAIVKAVINEHGGKIKADSRGEGLGTTILVQLPKV